MGVEQRIDALNDSIAALKLSLHALASQRKALDDAFCAALQPPAGLNNSRYRAMVATYGASAFTGNLATFFTARDQKVAEYTELATKIASGDASQVEIDKLTTFLTNSATDPALASAFWLSVGGEGTVRLFDAIGNANYVHGYDEGAMLEAAVAARNSMSAGTALWSEHDASLFVASFLALTSPGLGADTIGFLFNDRAGNPMGAPFASAMATGLVLLERDPNSGWSPLISGNYDSTSMGRLSALDCHQRDVGWYEALDPMSQVLSTLALYPEDSLAWLVDQSPDPLDPESTAGQARAAYLYGERDWMHDGGLAPADLWKSSLEAPGGVLDFGPADSQPRIDQAIVTTQVMNALASDGSPFMGGWFSDDALGSLGQAIGYELPSLVEGTVMIDQTTRMLDDVEIDGYLTLLPEGIKGYTIAEPMAVPGVDDGVLGRVWGEAARSGQGAAALSKSVDAYEGLLYSFASTETGTPPMTWDCALTRVAAVEGMSDGSMSGVGEFHAAARDSGTNMFIDGAGLAVGVLPIPGAEKIPAVVAFIGREGAEYVSDVATDVALEGASQFASEAFGGATEHAQSDADARLAAGQDKLESRIDGYYADPMPNFSDQTAGIDIETYKATYLQVYADKFNTSNRSLNRPLDH